MDVSSVQNFIKKVRWSSPTVFVMDVFYCYEIIIIRVCVNDIVMARFINNINALN